MQRMGGNSVGICSDNSQFNRSANINLAPPLSARHSARQPYGSGDKPHTVLAGVELLLQ